MDPLFELPAKHLPTPEALTRPEQARVIRPVRTQVEMVPRTLEETLPEDHVARAIWAFVSRLDLAGFYGAIKAVLDRPGHPATDPQVLLALWVLATAEGVGSARKLARLCEEHDAYRWLRGGVPLNYHLLADFRVAHQQALDEVLTEILAALLSAGVVTLRRVAHDGMKVRASAGKGTFHREATLRRCLDEARAQVERCAHGDDAETSARSRTQEAARERAAKERAARLEAALKNLPEVQAAKERKRKRGSATEKQKVQEPRVSPTDPEARVMKMPEGGFRPAYNLQLATDVDSQVIVGVAVTRQGNDAGQAKPMVERIVQRTQVRPEAYLMDSNFATYDDVTALEAEGISVYAPPPARPTDARPAGPARPRHDPPEISGWRTRMETDEAKTIYRQRAATAECVNAQGRAHGLTQLPVRGTAKVLSVLLWVAITHNILRCISLAG